MNLIVPHDFESNYVLGFAKGLAANGVKFAVISSDDTAPRLEKAGIPQIRLRGSISPNRPGWVKAANLLQYYLMLLVTVFRFRGRTIHFNGLLTSRFILFEGVVFPVWFRLWAGRYIHTVHNALPHSRENSRLFRWVYRWVYRFPHSFIAHTDKVARQLESEFGVDPASIAVISIGLNEEVPETSLTVEAARQQLGLPVRGPIALFFGKLEPYKGVDVLAEAWGKVRTPDARMLVVGWCSDAGYAREIHQAIARSPGAATMEWREGFLINEAVAVWFKACDVVVMPYRNIYQSGVVFLCLRFGIPIVATNVGSLAEYIDHETGIITETNDPAGIAAGLDRFFAEAGRFDRKVIAQRAEKYRWNHQCAAIKHLYC